MRFSHCCTEECRVRESQWDNNVLNHRELIYFMYLFELIQEFFSANFLETSGIFFNCRRKSEKMVFCLSVETFLYVLVPIVIFGKLCSDFFAENNIRKPDSFALSMNRNRLDSIFRSLRWFSRFRDTFFCPLVGNRNYIFKIFGFKYFSSWKRWKCRSHGGLESDRCLVVLAVPSSNPVGRRWILFLWVFVSHEFLRKFGFEFWRDNYFEV